MPALTSLPSMEFTRVLLCWKNRVGEDCEEEVSRSRAKSRIEQLLNAGIDSRSISLWGQIPLNIRSVVETAL